MRARAGAARDWLIALCLLISGQVCAALYPRNPLAIGGSIYVSHQGVYRFDAARTGPLWSNLAGVETFAPVVYRDLLLVGSTQGLYALRLADGGVAWHIEKQHSLFTPTLDEQAYAGSVHGELYAIRLPQTARSSGGSAFDGWIYSPAINDRRKLGLDRRTGARSLRARQRRRRGPDANSPIYPRIGVPRGRPRRWPGVAFNLFDGSSVVVGFDNRQVTAILDGDSQPTAVLRRCTALIYRGHSDGSLSAFAQRSAAARGGGGHSLTQDLVDAPVACPVTCCLVTSDRKLFLIDLAAAQIACVSSNPTVSGCCRSSSRTGKITCISENPCNLLALRLVKSPATCQ